jgi:hypothetical protein
MPIKHFSISDSETHKSIELLSLTRGKGGGREGGYGEALWLNNDHHYPMQTGLGSCSILCTLLTVSRVVRSARVAKIEVSCSNPSG